MGFAKGYSETGRAGEFEGVGIFPVKTYNTTALSEVSGKWSGRVGATRAQFHYGPPMCQL